MTLKTNEWIDVQYEDVASIPEVKHRGLTIRFMTSPLDVPDMWRCRIDNGRMLFEFRYLTTVESTRALEEGGVSFEVSKNSHRIYTIAIPLPVHDGHQLDVKIEMAISKMEALENAGAIKQSNADVIQNMLHKYQEKQSWQHC